MNNAYIRAQQCKVKEAKFPFVKIGTQYWTTKNLSLAVTPQGNTIPEMQANGNVEKISNIADREFSSDTGFWSKSTGVSITNGVARYVSVGGGNSLYKTSLISIGKWYKVSYSIVSFSIGGIRVGAGTSDAPLSQSVGTYTHYIYATSSVMGFYAFGVSTLDIDNISIQEIGWSGSQELYDGIYAQTSGTVEQKTYAAVKAAAMWSNYNNDAPTGLIYGKLYNWFAVKLFQMDIDYYNAANPTKPWGWRVPTQAEYQTLSTYLGGDAVSGGHLKEAGLAHWNSPNTGADNSSGFSALGGGFRNGTDGVFNSILAVNRFYSIDNYTMYMLSNGANTNISINSDRMLGRSIRIIKA